MNKRPSDFCNPDHPFYLAPVTYVHAPGPNEQWFLRAPVGVKKLNSLMKKMAIKANLPDLASKRITNSSVRKYLCQKLIENNVPDTQAIHITGHKNPNSLNNYRKLTNSQKCVMSSILSSNFKHPHCAPVESNMCMQSLVTNNELTSQRESFIRPTRNSTNTFPCCSSFHYK